MSRTFRHRHLYRGSGVARNFVDAGHYFWRSPEHQEALNYIVHTIHGAPCVCNSPQIPCKVIALRSYEHSHQKCAWNAGLQISWRTVTQVSAKLGLVSAVDGVGGHPIVRWHVGPNASRTYERQRGHQAIRAHARKINDRFNGPASIAEDLWLDLEEGYKHTRFEIDPWNWD